MLLFIHHYLSSLGTQPFRVSINLILSIRGAQHLKKEIQAALTIRRPGADAINISGLLV